MQDDQQPIYSFGAWLRRQRQTRGWMQKELAARLNCAVGTIKKIETDERRPGRALAERIATILDLPEREQAAMVAAARGERAIDRLALPEPAVSVPTYWASTPGPRHHQLRAPISDFIGRSSEISQLTAALRRAAQRGAWLPSAACRMGGIGKTELAYVVAHQAPPWRATTYAPQPAISSSTRLRSLHPHLLLP